MLGSGSAHVLPHELQPDGQSATASRLAQQRRQSVIFWLPTPAFESTVVIAASSHVVWDIPADLAEYPAWDSGVLRVEGTLSRGAKITVVSRVNPQRPSRRRDRLAAPTFHALGQRITIRPLRPESLVVRLLKEAGLVKQTPEGTRRMYRLQAYLLQAWGEVATRFRMLAENPPTHEEAC